MARTDRLSASPVSSKTRPAPVVSATEPRMMLAKPSGVRRTRQRAQQLMRADRIDPSRTRLEIASQQPRVLSREPVRAHREAKIQPALVGRPQHVFPKRPSPHVGVEGGGLLVGVRADRRELVFVGKLDRLVQVALGLGVLPARSRPRPLDQRVRRRVIFRRARPPTCDAASTPGVRSGSSSDPAGRTESCSGRRSGRSS